MNTFNIIKIVNKGIYTGRRRFETYYQFKRHETLYHADYRHSNGCRLDSQDGGYQAFVDGKYFWINFGKNKPNYTIVSIKEVYICLKMQKHCNLLRFPD